MDYDADVDLHVIIPDSSSLDKSGQTDVWYNARESHGVSLDHDCKGWVDSKHFVDDRDGAGNGKSTEIDDLTQKEMTTIRGKLPGRFDVGVHMFKFHRNGQDVADNDRDLKCPVRVEVIKLNPKVETIFSQEVILVHQKQCINVVSFDLDNQGNCTLADPPLMLVTSHVFDASGSMK
jgi:hypothetical protein